MPRHSEEAVPYLLAGAGKKTPGPGPDGSHTKRCAGGTEMRFDMSKNNGPAAASASPLSKGNLVYQEQKRWTFLGLPFTFTKYLFHENDLQIRRGFLNSTEDDTYMYRIIDVKLQQSLVQKMFGLGTIVCYTSDATDKTLVIKNIKHAREIKDFIYTASEEAKMRRRTVNMQNIGDYDDLTDDAVDNL